MVIVKTEKDITAIKEAVRIWKIAREAIYKQAKAGVSLKELDLLAKEVIEANGGIAAFHNYLGFKGHICISVNECVIHGVPTDYVLKDGDKVTFDVGVKYDNHYCDAAFTIIINNSNVEALKISEICKKSIDEAVAIIKPKVTTHAISNAIQKFIEKNGYFVLRDFAGHGCGNEIHEDPLIPNYRSLLYRNVTLEENMVICIEPMILSGSNAYYIDPNDQWSVKSKNHQMTCHWEHMILITKDGCEVLTA